MKNHTVAWCASCSRPVADTEVELGGDGRSLCPSCQQPLSPGRAPGATAAPSVSLAGAGAGAKATATPAGAGATELAGASDDEDDEEPIKAPWHFKVLVVGTAGYLVYRLIWVIFWLTGHAWHG